MDKRGVSPLIATVLIIGFTIALAAVVMIWGQTFFQGTTETTGERTSAELVCIQEVDMDVDDAVCVGAGDVNKVDLIITNMGDTDITEIKVKIKDVAGGPVTSDGPDADLPISNLETRNITADLTADLGPCAAGMTLIVYPVIQVEGSETTCSGKSKEMLI